MKLATYRAYLIAAVATAAVFGCSSRPTGKVDLVDRARESVERQECEAITLARALASAQRDAANASWDLILNAAAQNFRTREGLPLDAPLSDADHKVAIAIAHENLKTVLDHVSRAEEELVEAIEFDYQRRSQLLQKLVGTIQDETGQREILEALERLDDARRRADVDHIDHSFKKAIERQVGYVG
jgi:hypothetical protein